MRLPALLASALLIAPAIAPAQTRTSDPDPDPKADRIMIGLGLATLPQYEGADHQELLPIPGIVGQVDGITFTIAGSRASADLVTHRLDDRWHLALGPVAALGMNRTHLSVISDARVRALGKVGTAVELGGSLGLVGSGVISSRYDRLALSVSLRHDIAGGHGGTIIEPTLTYLAPVSRKALILLVAQAAHADDRYAHAYFSISPTQSAASTLPGFAARGGWKNWTLGAAIDHALTGDITHGLSLVAGASYGQLQGDFAASPVTSLAGSRSQIMAGLGLAYTF